MTKDEVPRNKSFLETIKELYPDEFINKPQTLRQQLHNLDEIIATEENHIDKLPLKERDESLLDKYKHYRDNKEWLNEG